jgi:hypothetical protein
MWVRDRGMGAGFVHREVATLILWWPSPGFDKEAPVEKTLQSRPAPWWCPKDTTRLLPYV